MGGHANGEPVLEATFDAVWHVKALAGDRQAITQLARAATNPLYRFCLYRVGSNHHYCEDVVQETLIKAIAKLEDYQPNRAGDDIFPWLTGLARNEIRRALVTEKRAESLDSLWAHMDQDMRHVLEQIDRLPLSSEVLERDETREMVNATMSQLPPGYRAALEAKYVDNRTVRQIAVERSTTDKAVESQLTRARQAFRETFLVLAKNLQLEFNR
jgi:RNA polymerase sigma-70 factor (ECF subfamily)